MAAASKELLELEQRERSFIESSLLLCNKENPLPQNRKRRQQASENVEGKPFTTTVPKSQVLGKVKDFLGVMAEANKRLELNAQESSRSNYDIEVLNGNETEYIEMDLLLGVADLHTPEAMAAAAAALGGCQPSLPLSDGSSSSDTENSTSDDYSDNENEEISKCPGNEFQESKLHESLSTDQPKKRPKILMLN